MARERPRLMQLGPWVLDERLGAGAFGAVYAAHHVEPPHLRRAVKILVAQDEANLARFRREAELLARIRHPGVVAIHEVGRAGADNFIVMDLVEGRSLRWLLDETQGAGIPLERALPLVSGIARAVGAAHAAGVCHRDLKPENVLVTPEGEGRVVDFGLATAGDVEKLTLSGTFVGTLGYMAPEQIDGKRGGVGPYSDVYSIAAILYELATGAALAEGSPNEIIASTLTGHHVRARDRRPDLPLELDRLLERALAHAPADRFPDANALATALDELEGRRARGELRPGRRWPVPATAAVVLVLVLALGGWAIVRSKARPEPRPSAATPTPLPSTSPTPSPSPSLSPSPSASVTPLWFLALRTAERPDPLPRQLRLGETPGEDVNKKDGSILVFVPGTRARVGSEDETSSEDERPVHEVRLSPYFVGKYELSVAHFARFVDATHHVTFAESQKASVHDGPHVLRQGGLDGALESVLVSGKTWRNPRDGASDRDDLPVVQVAWIDAVAYAAWAGLRLPTEAEWEVAASWDPAAGRARRFPWGDDNGDATHANIIYPLDGSPPEGLIPVTSLPASASPVGALNMAGKCREWVLDDWGSKFYQRIGRGEVSALDPVNLFNGWRPSVFHACRGGSFRNVTIGGRCANRGWRAGSDDTTGFRVALSLDGSQRPSTLKPYERR